MISLECLYINGARGCQESGEWNGGMENWNKSNNTIISQYHFPLSIYKSNIMHQLHKGNLFHLI